MRRGNGAPRSAAAGTSAVATAFDELRFGRENTLDLRTSLPSGPEAVRRAESFLRERQVASVHEVLVVTGRGNQSEGGVAVVRPAIAGALARLRRQGVVEGWQEHTPGSFVVNPAPITALLEVPRRHGEAAAPAAVDDPAFAGFSAETRDALRALAVRSLEALGAPVHEPFVQDEIQRQFSALGASIPSGPDREALLRRAAERALDELDDAE